MNGKPVAPTTQMSEDTVVLVLQVCAHKQQLADELSQLTGKHKQLQADKEAAETELSTLKPARAELQQMHEKAKVELQNTKTALQKSQEARVHAEVSTTTGTNKNQWHPSKQLAVAVGTCAHHPSRWYIKLTHPYILNMTSCCCGTCLT